MYVPCSDLSKTGLDDIFLKPAFYWSPQKKYLNGGFEFRH